jgi:DNA-binding NarL/FixJ family response regulator
MTESTAPYVLKIVTVDDSLAIAERLKNMLAEMDNVNFLGNARNITSALNLISLQKPDVVVLDIYLEDDMPKSNGINLLIILKKKYPDLKIIMLTNLSETQYRNTCVAFGADFFFDKTNEFDMIPETLEKLISIRSNVLANSDSKKRAG